MPRVQAGKPNGRPTNGKRSAPAQRWEDCYREPLVPLRVRTSGTVTARGRAGANGVTRDGSGRSSGGRNMLRTGLRAPGTVKSSVPDAGSEEGA